MGTAWERSYTVISQPHSQSLISSLGMRLESQIGLDVKTLMRDEATLMEPFVFFSVEVTTCKENLLKLIEYKQEQFVEGIS